MYFLERDNNRMDGDLLFEAKQELKRADHLMFVSLKYTRTVDVIKSIITRLINSFDISMNEVLEQLRLEGRVEEVPKIPRVRARMMQDLHNPKFNEYIDFYYLLRDINKSDFSSACEFRRHVTMTAQVNKQPIDITIDIIEDYFQKTKEFVDVLESMLHPQQDD